MKERFANDLQLAGRAYHDLFMGVDSDEAEGAALAFGEMVELVKLFLTKKE